MILGVGVFAALLPFVHADVSWFDAGELSTAAATLGVAHPTGFPLLAILGHALSLLPFGPLPFRLALLSAAAIASATALCHATAVGLGAGRWRAALGALFFPATYVAWLHGTLVEVYGLNACWIAGLAWLLLRPSPRLAAAALVTGLGLGAHATFVLTAAVIWVITLTAHRLWRRLPGLIGWGLAGAVILAYLPAAASRSPWLNWGDPSTPDRLLAHLTASGIRSSYAAEMGLSASGTVPALTQWAELAGGPAGWLAVGAVAIAAMVGRPRAAWIAIGSAVVVDAAFSALLNPMGQADLQTGVPGALGLALGLGLAAGTVPLSRRAVAGSAIAGVACLVGLAGTQRLADRALDDLAGPYGRFSLLEPSPAGVVLVSSDHLASQFLYLQGVEGMRRDQVVLVKQHLADTDLVMDRYARVGLMAPAGYRASAPEAQLDRLLALVGGEVAVRPVHWELGDGRFDPTLAPSLVPVALLYRLATDAVDAHRRRPALASPMRSLLAHTRHLDEPGFRTRRVFSDVARFRGVWHHFDGDPAGAAAMFEEAASFDPDNAPALLNLAVSRRAQGRIADAIALLERAIALRPDYAKAHENLRRYREASPP